MSVCAVHSSGVYPDPFQASHFLCPAAGQRSSDILLRKNQREFPGQLRPASAQKSVDRLFQIRGSEVLPGLALKTLSFSAGCCSSNAKRSMPPCSVPLRPRRLQPIRARSFVKSHQQNCSNVVAFIREKSSNGSPIAAAVLRPKTVASATRDSAHSWGRGLGKMSSACWCLALSATKV